MLRLTTEHHYGGTPEKVGFEVAWLLQNHLRVPAHQDKALGDIFKHYQPEHEQGL